MKRYFALLALTGCIVFGTWAPMLSQDSMDPDYSKKMKAAPLTFSVPKNRSDEIWSRINSFIGQYSSMKIQVASDFVIQTYNPVKYGQFGYYANRTIKGDSIEFNVTCISSRGFEEFASNNAHALAYYAATGEILSLAVIR